MRTILVEPSILESSASSIDSFNNQYEQCYRNLYQRVDQLSLDWLGQDNIAFNNQIKSYQDDLNKISMLLSEYSHFLRKTAQAYRQTQEELAAQAMRLTV